MSEISQLARDAAMHLLRNNPNADLRVSRGFKIDLESTIQSAIDEATAAKDAEIAELKKDKVLTSLAFRKALGQP